MAPKDQEPKADEADAAMAAADEADGEGRPDDGPANDTEARYGRDESPA